jgi:hypothetical protein
MRKTSKEGEPCSMCGTLLRSVQCGTCLGAGMSGLLYKHVCKVCGGSGKLIRCRTTSLTRA